MNFQNFQVAEDFDCSNDDKDSMIECLREQDAHDLAAFNITCTVSTMFFFTSVAYIYILPFRRYI